MVADSDSNIAWHRVQLKKNRAELKALETARFTIGEIATSKRDGRTQKTIAELRRKIAQSERCIGDHEKRTRRPELGSLKPGSAGDATIMSIMEGKFDYVDVVGEHLIGDRKIVSEGVVIAGRWWHPKESPKFMQRAG